MRPPLEDVAPVVPAAPVVPLDPTLLLEVAVLEVLEPLVEPLVVVESAIPLVPVLCPPTPDVDPEGGPPVVLDDLQTHIPNVPLLRQTCAPLAPSVHAQGRLAPGVHVCGSPVVPVAGVLPAEPQADKLAQMVKLPSLLVHLD